MNLEYAKNRTWAAYLLPLLLLIPYQVSGQEMSAQSATPEYDQLKQKFEEGQLLTAAFTHLYTDSYTGEESFSSGKIWIGEEMYRVEGEEQVMVFDGETSRVYDGIRNRLLINDYDEESDDFAPSRMLRGVDDSYVVTESTDSGHTVIILENSDPFALFYEVEIQLNEEGIPVEIAATDQAENTIVTNFSNGKFMPFDESLFEIDLPEDAERVDLRH